MKGRPHPEYPVSSSRFESASFAMPFVVATEAHVIPERPPLSLASGDVVTVGRRDSDWPAFVFVITGGARAGCRLAISRPMQGGRLWKRPTTPPSLRQGAARSSKSSSATTSLGGSGVAPPTGARAGFRAAPSRPPLVPRTADPKLRNRIPRNPIELEASKASCRSACQATS